MRAPESAGPIAALSGLLGIVLAVLSAAASTPTLAKPLPEHAEPAWSNWLAQELDADSEFPLFDLRRVDVLTDTHAIEVEWCKASKVTEAVEQARYYGVATGRDPAIVLLVGRQSLKEERPVYRAFVTAAVNAGVTSVSVLDVRAPNLTETRVLLGDPLQPTRTARKAEPPAGRVGD